MHQCNWWGQNGNKKHLFKDSCINLQLCLWLGQMRLVFYSRKRSFFFLHVRSNASASLCFSSKREWNTQKQLELSLNETPPMNYSLLRLTPTATVCLTHERASGLSRERAPIMPPSTARARRMKEQHRLFFLPKLASPLRLSRSVWRGRTTKYVFFHARANPNESTNSRFFFPFEWNKKRGGSTRRGVTTYSWCGEVWGLTPFYFVGHPNLALHVDTLRQGGFKSRKDTLKEFSWRDETRRPPFTPWETKRATRSLKKGKIRTQWWLSW